MAAFPKTSLEQWRVLQTIVEAGGYAQAAAQLHRSQSSVSYAVTRLQAQLGIDLLVPQGRRMVLTDAGRALLAEAAPLLESLQKLEARAGALRSGWEAEVRLAVDSLFPLPCLMAALRHFAAQCPATRLQMHEVVMSGADDALYQGQVDLAVATRVPPGFLGEWLLDACFLACAAPAHPLHALGRTLRPDDLVPWTQVVVRDSGTRQPRDEGWLGARQRWTVSHADTAVEVVESGLAFAWLPAHAIAARLEEGRLVPLPLAQGQVRRTALHLVMADPGRSGPAAQALADCLHQEAAARRGAG
ncbi:DNA-binding transcriptional regulator, LysR family [Gulbenkiania indica]|uniref:DNA-binding transcriptional regulator, LysR family n=1 Tax=Gulbenkiania indica TaxID=375574 RepID=A0A0K6GS67_9NEIS|nr:LysR family transcriptional regulator [Gulbenkiania indica]CUA81371.1 DNA-binding transcriptional regulator, LysR family [Gulbenkiania indica]